MLGHMVEVNIMDLFELAENRFGVEEDGDNFDATASTKIIIKIMKQLVRGIKDRDERLQLVRLFHLTDEERKAAGCWLAEDLVIDMRGWDFGLPVEVEN